MSLGAYGPPVHSIVPHVLDHLIGMGYLTVKLRAQGTLVPSAFAIRDVGGHTPQPPSQSAKMSNALASGSMIVGNIGLRRTCSAIVA